MIIKNKTVWVYDIEVFPNVFHCIAKNTESGEYRYFEISERRNDLFKIVSFFHTFDVNNDINVELSNDKVFCGYNNIHYDNVIINLLIEKYYSIRDFDYIGVTRGISNLSNLIIQNPDDTSRWKHWKYLKYFDTLDLLIMRFSSKLRVGLKEMQVTMKFHNVQEYEGDFTKPLAANQINEMIKYNKNDVDSTEQLLFLSQKDIDLRLGIEKEYGIDVLNKDGMSIGVEVIKHKYLEATHKTWNDIKDLRSPCDMIAIKDVLLPFIKFDTPILQQILEEAKQQIVSPGRKGYERHFLLDNVEHTLGVGGLHSVNTPEVITPAEDEFICDQDVASLYPSLIIKYGFYPPHLGREFLDVYSKIKEERIEAKHNGNKVKNLTLKLALNGISGQLQNEYNWCYSPKTAMKIRMNGQFLLLMLAEKLISVGCRIIQSNTDGIFYIGKKNRKSDIEKVCGEWENLTQLDLEADYYEKICQFAINDYIAIGEGYKDTKDKNLIKTKGMFVTETQLGKGMNANIIPNAVIRYFADGIPVKETIRTCKDINEFITYQKIDKKFDVVYNNKKIQRINRFYYSTNGYYLIKKDPDTDKCIKLNTKSGVTIVNNLADFEFPTNINYLYYESEANKIVSLLRNKQLELF